MTRPMQAYLANSATLRIDVYSEIPRPTRAYLANSDLTAGVGRWALSGGVGVSSRLQRVFRALFAWKFSAEFFDLSEGNENFFKKGIDKSAEN